jgi:hypothetical protein
MRVRRRQPGQTRAKTCGGHWPVLHGGGAMVYLVIPVSVLHSNVGGHTLDNLPHAAQALLRELLLTCTHTCQAMNLQFWSACVQDPTCIHTLVHSQACTMWKLGMLIGVDNDLHVFKALHDPMCARCLFSMS